SDIWTLISVFGIPLGLGYGATLFYDDYVEKRLADIKTQIESRGKEREKLQRELQNVKGYEEIKQQLERNSAIIRNKIDTIEKLIRDRDFATKSLMTLAQSLPKDAWITEYSQTERAYSLSGSCLDAGLISDFMGKLQKSIYYTNVQLTSSSSTDSLGMKADFKLQGKIE
ncbi:hypothetical protein EBZ37_11300, partial [bacterium]|nr:hypothetical protein [bacterium]